ncbi:MAG TPA: hypothetical protein VMU10_02440, partial [Desulfomonilia bacterium]|nr:hypothetical protein [Desulfomonilia bacterium]
MTRSGLNTISNCSGPTAASSGMRCAASGRTRGEEFKADHFSTTILPGWSRVISPMTAAAS